MVLIGGSFSSSITANDTLVRFKGAIGDIPLANVAGIANPDGTFPDVTRNIVRGVNPAGQIWVISAFTADVKVDGRIRVDGRGLLLGGGNTIGTNGNASVFATLICEATPPFTQFSTNITGVPLAANGDFRIDDMLMPAPPAECGSPVLLIRVSPSELGLVRASRSSISPYGRRAYQRFGLLPQVDNIWALQFGHDAFPNNGAHNQLFFTAGPDSYANGLLE